MWDQLVCNKIQMYYQSSRISISVERLSRRWPNELDEAAGFWWMQDKSSGVLSPAESYGLYNVEDDNFRFLC